VINEEQGDGLVLFIEAAQDIKRGYTGVGANDAIVGGIFGPKVAFDGAENFGIIVDCENYGPSHRKTFLP
jgi:hypothetical protein